MPQLRIYHQGRYMYYRPGRTGVHFLPPLSSHHDSKKTVAMRTVPNDESHGRGPTPNDDNDRVRRAKEYRKLVQHISRGLTKENVDDMKFLAKEHIYPTHLLDRISNGKEFITLLEQKKFLAENSLHFLQTLLYYVARHDLYERLFRFRYGIQGNYRQKGVKIEEKYNLFQRSGEILKLPFEVKSFRDELNPRSRFKNTDIPSMRRKFNTLSKKLDETRNKKVLTESDNLRRNHEVDADQGDVCNDPKTAFVKETQDRNDCGVMDEDKMVYVAENTLDSDLGKYTTHVKLKKLRKRLNVNLVKHDHNPGTRSLPVQQNLRGRRLPRNNLFARKIEGSKGSVHSSYEKDMTVKPILPSI